MQTQNKLTVDSHFVQFLIAGVSLAVVFVAIYSFSLTMDVENANLIYDWGHFWQSLEGGKLTYGSDLDVPPFNIPPWGAVLLMPLGLLPMRAGWSLIVTLTLAGLVFSAWLHAAAVSQIRRIIGLLLLVTTYPVLRLIADGNVDGIALIGIYMVIFGYKNRKAYLLAAGSVISILKPQVVFILLLFVGIDILRKRSIKPYIIPGLLVGLYVLVTMLIWAEAWLHNAQFLTDYGGISLNNMLLPLGVPAVIRIVLVLIVVGISLYVVFRAENLSYLGAGLLVSASLLASPYAYGLSLAPLMAIGVLPVFARNWKAGLLLFLLYDLHFLTLMGVHVTVRQSLFYSSCILIITWMLLLYYVKQESKGIPAN